MRKSQKDLPQFNALAFAFALGVVSGSAGAGTVATVMQTAGTYVPEANAAASVFHSQLLPALGVSVDRALATSDASKSAILHSNGHNYRSLSRPSLSAEAFDIKGPLKIRMTMANTTSAAKISRFDPKLTPGLLFRTTPSFLNGDISLASAMKFDMRRVGTALRGGTENENGPVSASTFAAPLPAAFDTSPGASSTHAYFSVNSVSQFTDPGVLYVSQHMKVFDQIKSLASSSLFASFEQAVLETTFGLPDQDTDGSALVRTAAARIGAPVKARDVPVAALPEPSTYALMFGSMAIISSTARRRRNDALGWMASRRREDVVA